MLTTDTAISEDNMIVEILGKNGAYDFKWRIIKEENNLLVPDRPIKSFRLKLSDLKQSLDGDE